jgi:peptidoglycan hydrolase-like protein with peptidoglycan-binding domain
VVAVLALVALVTLGASGSSSSIGGKAPATRSSHARTGRTRTASVATTIAPANTVPATTTATTLPALRVLRVDPADNAQGVGFRAPLTVTYNRAPGMALPTITPNTAGQWVETGAQVAFHPSGDWAMGTTYRISVPVGAGMSPSRTTVVKFTTRVPSVLTLQQYLAMLGYLPLRFTPSGDAPNRRAVLEDEPTNPGLLPVVPVAGTFSWAYSGVPGSLSAQWQPGQPNMVTMAAVMQFEMAQGLSPDGDAGPVVWKALLKAVAKRETDPYPYNYIIVSETDPETLYVWQDGQFVYNTLVNTGVPGAWTPQGTWPVDYKQNPNLMKGCDINGSCYSVWVAYASYFLPSVGDAIHAYPRYGYGYPQSNGCVEVEPSQGATVYSYDPVGTLVTVSSWVGPTQ